MTSAPQTTKPTAVGLAVYWWVYPQHLRKLRLPENRSALMKWPKTTPPYLCVMTRSKLRPGAGGLFASPRSEWRPNAFGDKRSRCSKSVYFCGMPLHNIKPGLIHICCRGNEYIFPAPTTQHWTQPRKHIFFVYRWPKPSPF